MPRRVSKPCLHPLLAVFAEMRLAAQLSQPVRKPIKGGLKRAATEAPGAEVAELEYQATGWPRPRRTVLLRHRVTGDESLGGKRLLDVPGRRFQAPVASLPKATHPPLRVWRHYNGQADCENVVREPRAGLLLHGPG